MSSENKEPQPVESSLSSLLLVPDASTRDGGPSVLSESQEPSLEASTMAALLSDAPRHIDATRRSTAAVELEAGVGQWTTSSTHTVTGS